MKQAVANIKGVPVSPRKLGVVALLVRDRRVDDALVILEHTPKQAAKPLIKAIKSAKANAENNHDMKADSLLLQTLDVGPGPRMKRYRPAARGRAQPYIKASSHIRVVIQGTTKDTPKLKTTKSEVKPSSPKASSNNKSGKKDRS